MYIKSLIIDGFKSYGVRTVIEGWDLEFNAITGLNGSGKSNILDSICFVLGISNLSQVRVNNLQELVYKQGQGHVTKASVTIVFNNEDKKASPVTFEKYDEITVTRQVQIGGRNKYIINGHTAQLNRVMNMFHSVCLNVNNPHFLIMQGRITKVLNMKPPEILAMVEEAAGIRMYELNKAAAVKTIQKKDLKCDEINRVIEEDLSPQMEALRKDKSTVIQWSANNTEIERLLRFLVAYDFFAAQEATLTSEKEVVEMEENLNSQIERNKDVETDIKDIEQEISMLSHKKSSAMSKEYDKLDGEVSLLSKQLVQLTSCWKNKKSLVDAEQKELQICDNTKTETKAAVAKKKNQLETCQDKVHHLRQAQDEIEDKLAALQSAQLGIDMSQETDDSKERHKQTGTLANQFMEAEKLCITADSEAKQARLKVKHLTKLLAEKQTESSHIHCEYDKLCQDRDTKREQVECLKQQVVDVGYDAKQHEALSAQFVKAEQQVSELGEALSEMEANMAGCLFEYTSPHKHFDRSQVKGMVAQLLKAKPHEPNAITAIEVTAGGRLYNVVVTNEEACKEVIEKGRLKRRVTMIPLNKIAQTQKKDMDRMLTAAQKKVGSENVCSALSLICYDDEVEAAMNYIFAKTIVCADAEVAKTVTFNMQPRSRSVTYEGDLYDTAGTITGGSRSKGTSVLARLDNLSKLREKHNTAFGVLNNLQKQVNQMGKLEKKFVSLNDKLELEMHQLSLLEGGINQSTYAKLLNEIQHVESEILDSENICSNATAKNRQAKERCAELAQSIKDYENQRVNKMKEIEKSISMCREQVAKSSGTLKSQQQKQEKLNFELQQLTEENNSLDEQQTALENHLGKSQDELETMRVEVSQKKIEYDDRVANLQAEKDKLAATDKEISQLVKKNEKLAKAHSQNDLEIKKLDHKIKRFHHDRADGQKQIKIMLQKHEWIAAEQHLFGKPNTDYDFVLQPPKKMKNRLESLQKEQASLSKRVNKKVMGMYEKTEQEYQDLTKNRSIIEKDRKKIEDVIAELDRKKNEALQTTWVKVNRDFGSIFSTLLPGANAKLEPPQNKTVLDGLEVNVAFGGVWKESLSELSGGQRSLLALSLILALLRFKPAPMYILDEIDAALDLSHTQNIGKMLKTHFSQSQFIVVSLKEGMFNNANVIFRTKFVDGTSTVSRTVRTKMIKEDSKKVEARSKKTKAR